jgi:hypothetical protein
MLFEIDQPILEHGGEVYGYVGDEVIESWPLSEASMTRAAWAAPWRFKIRWRAVRMTIAGASAARPECALFYTPVPWSPASAAPPNWQSFTARAHRRLPEATAPSGCEPLH